MHELKRFSSDNDNDNDVVASSSIRQIHAFYFLYGWP